MFVVDGIVDPVSVGGIHAVVDRDGGMETDRSDLSTSKVVHKAANLTEQLRSEKLIECLLGETRLAEVGLVPRGNALDQERRTDQSQRDRPPYSGEHDDGGSGYRQIHQSR